MRTTALHHHLPFLTSQVSRKEAFSWRRNAKTMECQYVLLGLEDWFFRHPKVEQVTLVLGWTNNLSVSVIHLEQGKIAPAKHYHELNGLLGSFRDLVENSEESRRLFASLCEKPLYRATLREQIMTAYSAVAGQDMAKAWCAALDQADLEARTLPAPAQSRPRM